MKYLPLSLLLFASCLQRPHREDPWQKYANQPVPEGNLRVDVTTIILSDADERVYQGALGFRGQNWSIVADGMSGSSGLTVFGGSPNFLAAFRASSRSARVREEQTSSILVADGYEAQVNMTRERLMPVTHVIPIYNGAVIVRTLEAVVTGSGFFVKPQLTDRGTVRLTVIPFLATQGGGWGKPIRITELSTTVDLQLGQPLVLMSDDSRQNSFGGALFSARFGQGRRRLLQVLTVRK